MEAETEKKIGYFRARALDDKGNYILEEDRNGTWLPIEGASGWTAMRLIIEEYQDDGHHVEWGM